MMQSIRLKILHNNTATQTTKYSSWAVQTSVQQIQDGGRPPQWKIEKLLYLSNGLTEITKVGALTLNGIWLYQPFKQLKL